MARSRSRLSFRNSRPEEHWNRKVGLIPTALDILSSTILFTLFCSSSEVPWHIGLQASLALSGRAVCRHRLSHRWRLVPHEVREQARLSWQIGLARNLEGGLDG
jgi:RNase P protein component